MLWWLLLKSSTRWMRYTYCIYVCIFHDQSARLNILSFILVQRERERLYRRLTVVSWTFIPRRHQMAIVKTCQSCQARYISSFWSLRFTRTGYFWCIFDVASGKQLYGSMRSEKNSMQLYLSVYSRCDETRRKLNSQERKQEERIASLASFNNLLLEVFIAVVWEVCGPVE